MKDLYQCLFPLLEKVMIFQESLKFYSWYNIFKYFCTFFQMFQSYHPYQEKRILIVIQKSPALVQIFETITTRTTNTHRLLSAVPVDLVHLILMLQMTQAPCSQCLLLQEQPSPFSFASVNCDDRIFSIFAKVKFNVFLIFKNHHSYPNTP